MAITTDSLLDHLPDADAPPVDAFDPRDGEVISPEELDTTATHVVCPWCWAPTAETAIRDGRLLGLTYVQRTYRCEPCSLTILTNQDAQPLTT